MAIDIFGLTIGKKEPIDSTKQESFVVPDNHDGTYTLETGGVLAHWLISVVL
mgnify:CR=1 FL=1